MKNYAYYNGVLQGRNHAQKKLANNTYAERYSDSINIRLYDTNIIKFFPDGRIVLDSGKYRTVTTKDRINQFSPVNIRQEKSKWYIMYNNRESVFYDGITVKNGRIIKPLKEDRKTDRYIKLINVYCKKLRSLEKLPIPGPGDCFYCYMRDTKTNKPLGDCTNNSDHLLSHLKEKYIMGSLIINALEFSGYNAAFVFQSDYRDIIVRYVKKYFKSKLGIAQ
jgi:hypothetical protein